MLVVRQPELLLPISASALRREFLAQGVHLGEHNLKRFAGQQPRLDFLSNGLFQRQVFLHLGVADDFSRLGFLGPSAARQAGELDQDQSVEQERDYQRRSVAEAQVFEEELQGAESYGGVGNPG